MKKVAVIGGSGFLGSYVCDGLWDRGFTVHILDLNPSSYLKEGMRFHNCDIMNAPHLLELFEEHQFEGVFNFAGLADLDTAFQEPVQAMELNVLGNLHVLEACRKTKVQKLIYASSAYANSSRGSFYGISKLTSEKLVEEYFHRYSLPFTILRYGSVYGERAKAPNGIYCLLKEAHETGKILHKGDGEEVREYIHARDAAKLSVDALESSEHENSHLILTGVERLKYKDLLSMISEILNDSIKIEYEDCDTHGHYKITPYSFRPQTAMKLAANPFIDMGQGLVDCLRAIQEDEKSGSQS